MKNPFEKSGWKFWDWVGYACIWVAAIVLSLDTGLKQYPTLAARLSGVTNGVIWGFAPIALLTVAGVLALVKHWPRHTPRRSDLSEAAGPRASQPVSTVFTATPEQLAELAKKLEEERNVRLEWQQRAYDFERSVEAITKEVDATRTEVARKQATSDEELRDLRWLVQFDMRRPNLAPLNQKESDEARIEIARLENTLGGLATTLQSVTDDLRSRCENRGSADFGYWFFALFAKQVVGPCSRSLKRLRQPDEFDARESFITFFLTYKNFREWLPRVAISLAIGEAEIAGYRAWRESDASFFEEVNRFPAVPSMSVLREFVREHRGDGYPANLNRAATENPVLQHIVSATQGERDFLDLFCIAELPMKPNNPATWLSDATYRAGASLVKHGILTHSAAPEGRERFCLTESALAVWSRGPRTTPPVTSCIVIDLNTVQGTGSSGGGARRR